MGKIYTRWVPPGGRYMGFPPKKSLYAYIQGLGLLHVVCWCRGEALIVIILLLWLSAGVVCCPPSIFKPSLGRREKWPQKVGRREKLAEKVGRREIYPPVPPPLSNYYRIPIGVVAGWGICTPVLSPTVLHLQLFQNKMTNTWQMPWGKGHAWNWLSH